MLNNVLRKLERIQHEGMSVDLMQEIRQNPLPPSVLTHLQNTVETGEVFALQELESWIAKLKALDSIAKIPAEDINRGFTADLSDKKWGKGLE
eukprot:scaffold14953_cov666-Ochromonas_danica.AAC.1